MWRSQRPAEGTRRNLKKLRLRNLTINPRRKIGVTAGDLPHWGNVASFSTVWKIARIRKKNLIEDRYKWLK